MSNVLPFRKRSPAIDDHNAAQWLAIKFVAGHRARSGRNRNWVTIAAGWYVVRTCPCHAGERVTIRLSNCEMAELAMTAMIEVAKAMGT